MELAVRASAILRVAIGQMELVALNTAIVVMTLLTVGLVAKVDLVYQQAVPRAVPRAVRQAGPPLAPSQLLPRLRLMSPLTEPVVRLMATRSVETGHRARVVHSMVTVGIIRPTVGLAARVDRAACHRFHLSKVPPPAQVPPPRLLLHLQPT